MMFGFYRIAAVSPRTVVADVSANLQEHLKAYREAVENGASLVVFPELSLTGATCGDLFRQDVLLKAARQAAQELAAATGNVPALFGLPVVYGNNLVDAAALAAGGKLVALAGRRCDDGGIFSADEATCTGYVNDVPLDRDITFAGGLRFHNGHRKSETVKTRSLITFDLDFAPTDLVETMQLEAPYAWAIYSTHKHKPDKPRLRLIIPLDRNVSPDEYEAISRKLASDIGMDYFDKIGRAHV